MPSCRQSCWLSHPVAHRSVSWLAAQPELRLLPEWSSWMGAPDCAHARADRALVNSGRHNARIICVWSNASNGDVRLHPAERHRALRPGQRRRFLANLRKAATPERKIIDLYLDPPQHATILWSREIHVATAVPAATARESRCSSQVCGGRILSASVHQPSR